MGTNIYAVKTLSEREKIAIKEIVDKEPFEVLKEHIDYLSDSMKIHIAKISYGWQLLFDWSPKNRLLYDHTKKSLNKYLDSLKDNGYRLENEYGEPYSKEALWEDFEKHKDGYYLEKYWKEHNEYQFMPASTHEFFCDGIRWSYQEFS